MPIGSLLALAFSAAFAAGDPPKAPAADAPCCRALAFWTRRGFGERAPLGEKISAAPPELVAYIAEQNRKDGWPNVPQPIPLDPKFAEEFRRAVGELPHEAVAAANAKLLGVFVVEDFGGTGYTEEVLDERGRPVAAIMMLDPSQLGRTANEWASWKESTTFGLAPPFELRARIEAAARDDAAHALQFIVLHELGHALSVGSTWVPSWHQGAKSIGSVGAWSFSRLSWTLRKGRWAASAQEELPEIQRLHFYRKPSAPDRELAGESVALTYEHLEKTDFPTLYAATNPYDDFAESYASYVHVVLMHRPYEVDVLRDGRLVHSFGSCWDAPRCLKKREALERILTGRN